MSRTIAELDGTERGKLTEAIKQLTPGHTHWIETTSGHLGTWSTPQGLWTIEIDYKFTRYTVRQGLDNKWVRFDDDVTWLEFLIEHLGALT